MNQPQPSKGPMGNIGGTTASTTTPRGSQLSMPHLSRTSSITGRYIVNISRMHLANINNEGRMRTRQAQATKDPTSL
ncbi:unnamed protein product [Rhodiola kirilowii]